MKLEGKPLNQSCDCRSEWQNIWFTHYSGLQRRNVKSYSIAECNLNWEASIYPSRLLCQLSRNRSWYKGQTPKYYWLQGERNWTMWVENFLFQECNPLTFPIYKEYFMLFRQGSEKCQVIDAIGNLGLLPHWPAYIPMVRLRYPTKMKLATRSAMRII